MPEDRPGYEMLLRCATLSGAAQAKAEQVINEITHPESPGGLDVTPEEAREALRTIQSAIMWLNFLGQLVTQAAQEYEQAERARRGAA